MPLYNPSDENLAALLTNAGCEAEVDQGEGQCYYVRRLNDVDGPKVRVEFGASLAQFDAACAQLHAATAAAPADAQ